MRSPSRMAQGDLFGHDDVARQGDPIRAIVQEARLYMQDLGFRCLVVGKDTLGEWRCFLF
jgi:hypothetical protein